MQRPTRTVTTSLLTAVLFMLPACNAQPAEDVAQSSSASWLLETQPEHAVGVLQAKAEASEGDTVVVRGIIGGTKNPLTADSPVFRIIDTGLFNRCVAEDGDHCSTPWDYCCAPRETITEHSATVQLTASDGTIINDDLIASGLKPRDTVMVVGTVAPRPNEQVLVVNATGIYRMP